MHQRFWVRSAVLSVAAATLPLTAAVAVQASTSAPRHDGPAVFVQSNNPAGNSIVVYDRSADGRLSLDAVYATGGRGGRARGASSDSLASQGSLAIDRARSLLFAVNAGSDSISVFRIHGDELDLLQVVGSNGEFPVSLAVHRDLLVVLNAGGVANVSGFRIDGNRIHKISNDTRTLGLAEKNPPDFLASPAQVGFTPGGYHLIVTGKTNNFIDVFSVSADGRLSQSLTQTIDNEVPFAFVFSPSHQLDLVNAAGTLAPSIVRRDGSIGPRGPQVSDGQTAACWITVSGDLAFVVNTGSNDISEYRLGQDGEVTLVDATAATGISGAIDAATAGGQFLYVQSGLASSVKVYAIGAGGALTLLQTAHVPGGAHQEGIVTV